MTVEPRTLRPSPGARKDWSGLAAATRPYARSLTAEDHLKIGGILRDDVLSEYDARFLSEHLHGLSLDFSPEFLVAERRWAGDEERHYRLTARVHGEHWSSEEGLLKGRVPDFEPLAALFTDELGLLVLLAYDELVTVRAYQANLAHYAKLGPAYLSWARALIADEAWHYAAFLGVIRDVHRERLSETPSLLDRVLALEGTPYSATFVLDHDDSVFTEPLLAKAARLLRRHLAVVEAPEPGEAGGT